jgi:hypothetical protein
MKRETRLTKSDEEEIFNIVDKGNFGDCYQDAYLTLLCTLLDEKRTYSGMKMPYIVCDQEKYRFVDNRRSIVDIGSFVENDLRESGDMIPYLREAKEIFAYFDHPIALSALYLGTFNKHLIYPMLTVVSIIGAKCNTTPLATTPITLKIDMNSFINNLDVKKIKDRYVKKNLTPSSLKSDIIHASTLKYLSDKILGPEELFDVVGVKPSK